MNEPAPITRDHAPTSSRSVVESFLQNMAIQDWIALAFHFYLFVRIHLAPDSVDAETGRAYSTTLLLATLITLVLVRGELIGRPRVRALVYRVGLFVPMVFSYFELRSLLAGLQPKLLDMQLFAIDELLFGATPSVWLSQFNSYNVTEWLAFFYYLHFPILVFVLIPSLFLERGRRLLELMGGALFVVAVGHVGYTLVPGAGPYATIEFASPLVGGPWWHRVEEIVAAAGAHLDIFPSLHTAFPVSFALYAFGNRARAPFKWLWPFFAFSAVNIVVATMYLRWHWGIDVLAGLLLAVSARNLAFSLPIATHSDGSSPQTGNRPGNRCFSRDPPRFFERRTL
ncbi:MAG: phosphatase PAP2 family protein [Polyangiales bacterium]